MNLLVRASGNPSSLVSSVAKVVGSMDKDQPIFDVKTMEDRLADSLVSRRFEAALTGAFAVIAIFLASVGVYRVMSYLVSLRTSEFGIRSALGADRLQLLMSICREGITLALVGTALGIASAFALGRYLVSLLYGVYPHDPSAFIAAVMTLVARGHRRLGNSRPPRLKDRSGDRSSARLEARSHPIYSRIVAALLLSKKSLALSTIRGESTSDLSLHSAPPRLSDQRCGISDLNPRTLDGRFCWNAPVPL